MHLFILIRKEFLSTEKLSKTAHFIYWRNKNILVSTDHLPDLSSLVFFLLFVILGSIVVSIPACHAGDRASIPRRGGLDICLTRNRISSSLRFSTICWSYICFFRILGNMPVNVFLTDFNLLEGSAGITHHFPVGQKPSFILVVLVLLELRKGRGSVNACSVWIELRWTFDRTFHRNGTAL